MDISPLSASLISASALTGELAASLPVLPLASAIPPPLLQAHAPGMEQGLWPWLLAANVPNQVLVLVVLAWVLGKLNVPKVLDGQIQHVQAELVETAHLRETSERQLRLLDEQMATLPQQLADIEQQSRQTATMLANQLQDQSTRELERLARATDRRAQQEERRLLAVLEGELGAELLQVLQRRLAEQMNAQTHRRLVEGFLDRLLGLLNGSSGTDLQQGGAC